MSIHVGQQLRPVDAKMLLENEVHNIGAVVTTSRLHKGLRPDELGRRDDADRHAENFHPRSMFKPAIINGHDAIIGGEYDIKEIPSLEYLGEPAIVLDRDGVG